MNSPNLYKPPTRFAVVKTYSPNLYMPSICFALVKTDGANIHKHSVHNLVYTWTSFM